MAQREYPIHITINSRKIHKVVIDSHYEVKHKPVIDGDLILKLVSLLNGGTFPVLVRDKPYEYFVTDKMLLDGKLYKLVWLLEDDELYFGIVNTYRRR